jgi:RNA polymerase sigma-70 factor (ECF subfamily)
MAPRRANDTRDDAERSFEQLYRGHRGEVYRAALRQLGNVHDAEDVTQAAFIDAYRAVLRGTRPQAPRAWLLTIAENVRRRRFRASLRRPREEPLDADAAPAAEQSHEEAGALLDALTTLTAEQREVFLLREITGLSYDEIAEQTDSSVASVQMLLFRARKSLREELEPPSVHGLCLPLASLVSRFEAFSLTPRAAGAVGAAALAVSVSASTPAKADPPARQAAPPVVAAPVPATAVPVRSVPPRQAPVLHVPARRAPVKRAPARPAAPPLPAPAAPIPAAEPIAAAAPPPATAQPQPKPAPVPEAQPQPELRIATPPVLPVASPAVPTPSIPLPSLPDLVEPLLEGDGAAGAAGAVAPPLPVLPLDPLPPLP